MESIGFIGLGKMGSAMAGNLLKAGSSFMSIIVRLRKRRP